MMQSEMRRMARLLVERRSESFASRHSADESQRRLEAALAPLRARATRFEHGWHVSPEGTTLDAHFSPPPRTRLFLQATSIALAGAIAASAWALLWPLEEPTLRFLLPIATLLGILGFPFVLVALGAQREAEEARLRQAIRRALSDEEAPGGDRSR